MPCPRCKKPSSETPWFKPYCSLDCKSRAKIEAETSRFACRWCNASVVVKSDTQQAKYKVCSRSCFDKISKHGVSPGLQAMDLLFSKMTHEVAAPLTDKDLGAVARTHPMLTKNAMRGQLGPWYEDHTAVFYKGGKAETVGKDRMIEIAIASYRTACKLASKGLPVVLYRVKDKRGRLTEHETRTQAVCGAVPDATDVWPLERTAAWLQGAMRARVPFLMITDPRGEDNLIGGHDKSSDAIYVRELFQISQTKYTIAKATGTEIPAGWTTDRPTAIFKMVPPANDSGPLPIVPKLRDHMDYSHTWDSKKSSLTVDDEDTTRMAEHVKGLFDEAGTSLGVPDY